LAAKEQVYVRTTVLLESEWVRRRGYRLSRERIITALAAFDGLPRVTLEDPAVSARALDWARNGMDFADALHLAKAQGCGAFISCDQKLVTVVNALREVNVRTLRQADLPQAARRL
jgi:predicted nucleic-acid-binding protein